jgi:hypothetical protein
MIDQWIYTGTDDSTDSTVAVDLFSLFNASKQCCGCEVRILTRSDRHHFAGSGSVSISTKYKLYFLPEKFQYAVQNIENYDTLRH